MKNNKVFSLMGLATRAKRTVSGEFSVEKTVRAKQAFLVVVAQDASDNTKKKFSNMCYFHKVPIFFYGKKEEIGHSMGQEQRSSMAFLDEGFAKTVIDYLENKE